MPCVGNEASKHLACLERFSGCQPSFHLHEAAIRFWDDYRFGKSGVFGDTLPHHLSCLTSRACLAYARLTGDDEWVRRAEEGIRNGLCLIGDDGTGSAACVYPRTCNEMKGEFFDEWANDQDLVLYEAICSADLIDTFRLPERQ